MQAVVRGRQGEGKVGCLMPAEGDGGRWTGRRGSMERGGVLLRETGRGAMGRGYFCDGMPGWTYFSQTTPGHPAGGGERATRRGQGWLTDVV